MKRILSIKTLNEAILELRKQRKIKNKKAKNTLMCFGRNAEQNLNRAIKFLKELNKTTPL